MMPDKECVMCQSCPTGRARRYIKQSLDRGLYAPDQFDVVPM